MRTIEGFVVMRASDAKKKNYEPTVLATQYRESGDEEDRVLFWGVHPDFGELTVFVSKRDADDAIAETAAYVKKNGLKHWHKWPTRVVKATLILEEVKS